MSLIDLVNKALYVTGGPWVLKERCKDGKELLCMLPVPKEMLQMPMKAQAPGTTAVLRRSMASLPQ